MGEKRPFFHLEGMDIGDEAHVWPEAHIGMVHGTAAKANQDKNGNDIPGTYATKDELVGYSLVNGVPSFTYTV